MRARFAIVAVTLGFAACNAALACGPFFPNAYFTFGSETQVLRMPEASFVSELQRLFSAPPRKHALRRDAQAMRDNTLDADAASLRNALKQPGGVDNGFEQIVEKYRALRTAMQPTEEQRPANLPATPVGAAELAEVTKLLPREFALYTEGAALYHARELGDAIEKWKELLALPEASRKHRSVWAAYMIGRAERDTAEAVKYYEMTRELAKSGFDDPMNLAGESVGWQAQLYFQNGNITAAIRRYADTYLDTASPAMRDDVSLHQACRAAFKSPESLHVVVQDNVCLTIVSAFVVSHPNSRDLARKWLDAVSASGLTGEAAQADLLAWSAYEMGDFDGAQKWLDTLSSPTPYGQWVRSKLLIHEGRIDESVDILCELVKSFPDSYSRVFEPGDEIGQYFSEEFGVPVKSPRRFVGSELGVLLLGRGEYLESLDLLLRYGYWLDAAYIAERVLTIDELRGYVDAHSNSPARAADSSDTRGWGDGGSIAYLLGRRLVREGRMDEALAYLPANLRETAARLSNTLHEARAGDGPDSSQSLWGWFVGAKPMATVDPTRARRLYDAAMIVRESGMELMGTEITPDCHVFEGQFEMWSDYGGRERWVATHSDTAGPSPPGALPVTLGHGLAASEDERRRARESAPKPDKRFHYRYLAADLMWQAAQLLPDNDTETMRALYTGGSFLKGRDPKAANKFYRALVWRNPNMPYAQMADKLRWFPEGPPE